MPRSTMVAGSGVGSAAPNVHTALRPKYPLRASLKRVASKFTVTLPEPTTSVAKTRGPFGPRSPDMVPLIVNGTVTLNGVEGSVSDASGGRTIELPLKVNPPLRRKCGKDVPLRV